MLEATHQQSPPPAPTPGRIVLYTISAEDADAINRRRADARVHLDEHRANSNGVQIHVGNSVAAGEEFPMVVVRVWGPGCINGQVLLDGNDTYWATSRVRGEGPGSWCWPART
jgi:hypothetical protein